MKVRLFLSWHDLSKFIRRRKTNDFYSNWSLALINDVDFAVYYGW